MRAASLLLAAVACASPPPAEAPTSAPPASASAPAGAPASATGSSTGTATPTAASAAASAAPAAAPAPTGGSVLIGEIPGSKKFNPKPVIEDKKDAMVDCYNKARASKPDLSGKLKLLILVNGAGTVLKVDAEPGGSANDPKLVACIEEALKTAAFPKPGGMATVVAPLVFRP